MKKRRGMAPRRAEIADLIQVFFWKVVPQLRQEMEIFPLPLGTRSSCPQVGQRKYL